MKVSELTGALLDYWVTMAGEEWKSAHRIFPTMTMDPTFKGVELFTFEGGRRVCRLVPNNPFRQDYQIFEPHRIWDHGGPIIEREFMNVGPWNVHSETQKWQGSDFGGEVVHYGATFLEAGMRAYVASKFGDEVPDQELAS